MQALLAFVASNLYWLFDGGWFRIVDGGSRYRFDSLTVRSEATEVQIVNENGELGARVRAMNPESDWYWTGILARYLDQDPIDSDALTSESADRLRVQLIEVDRRFGDPNARILLVRELAEVASKRADERYGPTIDL